MPDNAAEMMRMQQEAIRRVRSMQERAQRSVRSEPADSADDGAPAAVPAAASPAPAPPTRRRLRRAPQKSPVQSAFSRLLTGDSEQMLLLVRLRILMDERTDPALILALLYVIL